MQVSQLDFVWLNLIFLLWQLRLLQRDFRKSLGTCTCVHFGPGSVLFLLNVVALLGTSLHLGL